MTDLEQQFDMNAALVEQRVAMGDLAQYPRPLDHMASFPKRRVDAATAALASAGFSVNSVRRGIRRARVEFTREDSADVEAANAVTREVVGIVDGHEGTYDGWAGFLIEQPPAD